MDQFEIASILREIAFYLQLMDQNPLKAIAYKKAANSIDNAVNFEELFQKNELQSLPGIGQGISKMINTLHTTGTLPYYEKLRSSVPDTLFQLLKIPGMSVRKIRLLYENLHITTIQELEDACLDGRIASLKGFGKRAADALLKKMAFVREHGSALLWVKAMHLASSLRPTLSSYKEVTRVEFAGELRRKMEIVSQLDFLVQSDEPKAVVEKFSSHHLIDKIIQKNDKQISVWLRQGIQVNIYVFSEKEFFLQLFVHTGSTDHIKKLTNMDLKQVGFKSEEEIYHYLHLQFIPPELREDKGEIEAAAFNRLPNLINDEDLCGAFHCHTNYSDGRNTIIEMANGAKQLGWQYIGIADHSKSSFFARGMKEEKLIEQVKEIQLLNASFQNFRVFSGVECDILKDGELDFSNDILAQLDYVVVSVHSLFKMEKELMTKRLIKAIENPYTTIIGHLTGRILLRRLHYELDIKKVIDACIANKKVVELNAYPDRLDMDWRYWIEAKDKGLKCSINPDAHRIGELANCKYGINIARKGWLEKKDVINTLSLKEMEEFLRKKEECP